MSDYKQGVQAYVPVRVIDPVGNPIPAITDSDVTVSICKSTGTVTTLSLVSADWVELISGAFGDSGTYLLRLSASNLDTTGMLLYSVEVAGALTFVGDIKVIANEVSEVFTAVGTANTSLSAITTNLATANTGITNANSSLGTITTNLATANTGISNANSSLGTITTNLATANSGITAANSTLGTVNTNVNTVNTNVNTVNTNVTALTADVATLTTNVELLLKHTQGRWKIHTEGPDINRFVVYDEDDETPLFKWDLKDATGAATILNPLERVPV